MEGTVLELDQIKNAKMKDEKKIEQLQKGWALEREQVHPPCSHPTPHAHTQPSRRSTERSLRLPFFPCAGPKNELVKMAMSNQHRQELDAVRASGREKMAAMQNELVQTMAMLEKMYSGWQVSKRREVRGVVGARVSEVNLVGA